MLYSYVAAQPPSGHGEEIPHVLAVIELEEGPRIMSEHTAFMPGACELREGIKVEIVLHSTGEEVTLFSFRPLFPSG